MELAVLTAGIDAGRKVCEQPSVEAAAGEGRVEGARVDASEDRLEACLDELGRELGRVAQPEREERLASGLREPLLPVGADVLEKEIAEGNRIDERQRLLLEGGSHPLLVELVAAGGRDRDLNQRDTEGVSLPADERSSDPVHRDPVVGLGDGRDQRDRLDPVAPKRPERERRVLPATPAEAKFRTVGLVSHHTDLARAARCLDHLNHILCHTVCYRLCHTVFGASLVARGKGISNAGYTSASPYAAVRLPDKRLDTYLPFRSPNRFGGCRAAIGELRRGFWGASLKVLHKVLQGFWAEPCGREVPRSPVPC